MENNIEILADDWTVDESWNAAFLKSKPRTAYPRDYLWASELGKSAVDIYLRLTGVEASNHPDERALRKMEAGNYFEYLIKLVMIRAGILQSSQERIEYTGGAIKVTGRLDFIGGGTPNLVEAEKMMQEENTPESMKNGVYGVVSYLLEKYPNGLASKIVEVKSLALIGFEKVLRDMKPIESHVLQVAPYIMQKKMPAMLTYICRDDMRMLSFNIYPHHVEELLHNRLQFFKDAIASGERPAIEPLIVFNELDGKFTFNFNVAYSPYLTMLYTNPVTKEPFAHSEDYRKNYATSICGRWNRVLKRLKDKKDLTSDNQSAIEDMKAAGFDVDSIVESFHEEIEEVE